MLTAAASEDYTILALFIANNFEASGNHSFISAASLLSANSAPPLPAAVAPLTAATGGTDAGVAISHLYDCAHREAETDILVCG